MIPKATPEAGFYARAMALYVDLFFLGCLQSLFLIVGLGVLLVHLFPVDPFACIVSSSVFFIFFFAGIFLVPIVYFTVLHAFWGQTIGKMLFGLTVVSQDRQPLSIDTAFLRCAASFLSFLSFGAGFFWPLLDNEYRTWHDRIANTCVVPAKIS